MMAGRTSLWSTARLDNLSAGKAPTSHLFHNNHDGTFTDVTEKIRLINRVGGKGVCVGDYDTTAGGSVRHLYGKNVLYHNTATELHRCRRTSRCGRIWKLWGTGCAFVDYDRDGKLDLMVANYVDFDLFHDSGAGERASCVWKRCPLCAVPAVCHGPRTRCIQFRKPENSKM